MAEKRHFELLVVDLVPHALRRDAMTIGVVVVEAGGEFRDVRFTRDWKRVQCFAPDLEIEILEVLERELRERLKEIGSRDELLRLIDQRFGMVFEVGPAKALIAEDPAAEMRILERDYLAPMEGERGRERARGTGRVGIVGRMADGLADAGVLDLVMRDVDMSEFTGADDAFHVDFGYRVGKSFKMLQALALSASRDPAVALAYRFTKIQEGMRKRGDEAVMTAVVSEIPPLAQKARQEWGTQGASAIAVLRANEIAVRSVEEMGEIAAEVRRELVA